MERVTSVPTSCSSMIYDFFWGNVGSDDRRCDWNILLIISYIDKEKIYNPKSMSRVARSAFATQG